MITASTEREKTLVKQALDSFALDVFIVLSGSTVEVDSVSLDKIHRLIEAAERSKVANSSEN